MQTSLNGHIIVPSQAPSVIPIVAPTEEPVKTISKIIFKGNDKRLCRNVIIHGFCKYEGKGCEFSHSTNSSNLAEKNKQTVISSVSVSSINAPEFVPRFTVETNTSLLPDRTTHNLQTPTNEETIGFAIDADFSQLALSEEELIEQDMHKSPEFVQDFRHISQPTPTTYNSGMVSTEPSTDPYMYMNSNNYPRQPLQHHFYSPSLPTPAHLLSHQKPIQSFFLPDKMRVELTQRNEAQWVSTTDQSLPSEVHVYHSLYPLEQEALGNYIGFPATVYKAICKLDRRSYALIRIEGYSKVYESAIIIAEKWRNIRHCNVVSFCEGFTTKAFGDNSLVFVYDYHPSSKTLSQKYFQAPILYNPSTVHHNGIPVLVPEKTLWSYIVQIVSAIRTVHQSGLACRNIDLNRILWTGHGRLRLNGVGILDVLENETGHHLVAYQEQDLQSLGQLIMALACPSRTEENYIDHIAQLYSQEIVDLVNFLLDSTRKKTIDDVLVSISSHVLEEINHHHSRNDDLEKHLSRELENGRMARLISKMGFINERPEFDMDPSWSETGDRYLIKLFRDYVFHQVDENGLPVIDMVHVLTCLKKLDAGVDERIMLMSRDEQSCLVVSFKEIKNCIASAYTDLSSGRK
ncbi:hypothetical protein BY458DRAFT_528842 [Sporodiniella umbellata]|nr:hypothetical protein BY458DRAFT_528842 [Sporodiniella umbellata]